MLDSVGSSNSTKILAPIVQAVAVLVFNLRPIRTQVFVHAFFPLSISYERRNRTYLPRVSSSCLPSDWEYVRFFTFSQLLPSSL